jgi:hypothetical protein
MIHIYTFIIICYIKINNNKKIIMDVFDNNNDQKQFREIAAVFDGGGAITNLEYHKDGQNLVMTTSESSIHLIDWR